MKPFPPRWPSRALGCAVAVALAAACRSTEPSAASATHAADAAHAVEVSAESRGRPLDPWVFRSVLDGNPRMLTAALHEDLWLAIDVEHAAVWRVWDGGVHFTGTVYDTLHGPQPMSRGPAYFGGPSRVGADGKKLDVPAVEPVRGLRLATGEPAELRWLGHRLLPVEADGRRGVELLWRFERRGRTPVDVALRPEAHVQPAGLALRLDWRVDGLAEGEALLLELPAASEPPRGVRRTDAITLSVGQGREPSLLSVRGSGRIEFLLPSLAEPAASTATDVAGSVVEPTLAGAGARP